MIRITLALLLLSLFFIILYLVITGKIEKMDQSFYEMVAKKINKRNTTIMKTITFFGSTPGITIIILISFFFLRNKFDCEFLVISVLGEVLLNNLIKIIVKRIRPSLHPLVIEKSHSFPSGHSMASTVFYSLLLFFLWTSSALLVWKIIITIFAILLVLSIMFSRVYLGVHFLSDVIAGLICGLSYALIVTTFYNPLQYLIL